MNSLDDDLKALCRRRKLLHLLFNAIAIAVIAAFIKVTCSLIGAFGRGTTYILLIEASANFLAAIGQLPILALQHEIDPNYYKKAPLNFFLPLIIAFFWSYLFVLVFRELLALYV